MKLTLALFALAFALISTPAFAKKVHAQVSLGSDCGTGASVSGNATSGTITLGSDFTNTDTCTITFATADASRVCFANYDAFGSGYSIGVSIHSSTVIQTYAPYFFADNGGTETYGCVN